MARKSTSSKITTELELTGEKKYRDAVRQVNSDLSLLSAQIKNVASDMAINGETTDKLINQYKLMQQAVETSQSKIARLNEAISANAQNQEKISTALSSAKDRQLELVNALERAKTEFGENSSQARLAQAAVDANAKTVEKLENALRRAENSGQKFKTQLATAESQLNRSARQLQDFANAHGAAITEEQKLNAEIQHSTERNKVLNERIQILNNNYKNTTDKLKNIHDRQKAYNEQIQNSEKKVQALSSKLEASKSKYDELAQKLAEVKNKFGENSDEAKIAANALDNTGKEVDELTNELEKANGELAESKVQLNNFNRETGHFEITKKFTSFKDKIKDVNSELAAIDPRLAMIAEYTEKAVEKAVLLAKAWIDVNIAVEKVSFKAIATEAEVFAETVEKSMEIGIKAVEGYTAALGLTVGATAAYTAKSTMDFESQMSTVQAIADETGEAFEPLREKAFEMGKTTVTSATDAGKAMEYMAMAGWTIDEIERSLQNVVNLAVGSGEDIAQVSDIVTDAMTAFGMSADQSAHFVNVLAKTATNSNTNVEMLGETFRYVAPLAGTMGYSVDDMATAIGLMANQGIKASQAGTALRSFINRLAAPTKDSEEAMEELGMSLVTDTGEMKSFSQVLTDLRNGMQGLSKEKKVELGKKLAGMYGATGVAALANTTEDDLNKIRKAIAAADDEGGAAARMAKIRTDNLAGDIQKLKNNVEALAQENGGALNGSIRGIVQEATALTQALNDKGFDSFMGRLRRDIPKAIGSISSFIEEETPELTENFNRLISTVIRSIPKLMPPIIKTLIPELIDGTTNLVLEVVDILPEFAPQVVKALATLANGVMSGLNKVMAQVIKVLPQTLKDIGVELKDAAPTFLQNALLLFEQLLTAATISIDELAPYLDDIVSDLTQILIDNAPKLTESTVKLITAVLKALKPVAEEISNNLPTLIREIGDTLVENSDELVDAGVDLISILADAIAYTQPVIISEISKLFNKTLKSLTSWENRRKLADAAGDLISAFVGGLVAKLGTLISAVETISEAITDAVDQDILEPAINWGADLVDNFLEGLMSKWKDWTNFWDGFGGYIYDTLHHSHPDKGLLKDDYTWMPDMMISFAKGIKDNKYRVLDEVNSVAEGINNALSPDITANMPTPAVDKAVAYEYGNSYSRNYTNANNTYNIPVNVNIVANDISTDSGIRYTAERLARETQYQLAGLGLSGDR